MSLEVTHSLGYLLRLRLRLRLRQLDLNSQLGERVTGIYIYGVKVKTRNYLNSQLGDRVIGIYSY